MIIRWFLPYPNLQLLTVYQFPTRSYATRRITAGGEDVLQFLKPSGRYMYHQFNIQQFYILPTHCVYMVCVDLRTNSDYFPVQH